MAAKKETATTNLNLASLDLSDGIRENALKPYERPVTKVKKTEIPIMDGYDPIIREDNS